MADVGAIKRRIAELQAKGEINKAITELEKAIKDFPKEGTLFNILGDLYIKVNRQKEALDVYEQGAFALAEETFYSNAVSMCKKILRLDKERTEIYKLLGDCHKELGLYVEAANYYLEYADRKLRNNEIDAALKTYEAIKELVPNNYKIIQTISAIYEKIGRKEQSAEFLKEAERIETKQKELKEAVATPGPPPEVEEKIVEPQPVAETGEELKEKEVKEEATGEPLKIHETIDTIPKETIIEEKVVPPIKEELSLEDFVSPEVAQLLKDEVETKVPEVVEEPAIEPEELSEIEKTKQLAEIYLNLGEDEEAINCFRDAAAMAFKDKKFDQAMELYKRIADLRPLDLKSRQRLIEIAKLKEDKSLQVNFMIELAETLYRREAKTEAQSVLRKILEIEPENAIAQHMIEEETKVREYIDLGQVLRSEIEGEAMPSSLQSINELISQFRKEVFESIGEGDYRSHYDLGVAYKGMGLFQEAIEEFEIAAKDEKLKLKSYEMIAACFIEKGNIDEAIKVLNEGLAIPNHPVHEYFGLHFMLGNAYEMKNDLKMAIKSYINAANIDKTVPDLLKKINELKNKLTEELKKRAQQVPQVPRETPKATQPEEVVKPKKSKVTYL
ncbi:MAG: tetratricopeptide repeat protein [candidate division WOR-3 bacterium]|nr:tetratricopeptide repeat protein [candidate division WOR-3 bacterium]